MDFFVTREYMTDPELMNLVNRRGPEATKTIDAFFKMNDERKSLQSSLDEKRAERNAANKKMASSDKASDEFTSARNSLKELSSTIKSGESKLTEMEDGMRGLHLQIPNAPHESCPDGNDESANQQLRVWGEKPVLDFEPKAHWDLGEALGVLDFEAGAKLAGARFTVLRGMGSKLNRALLQWMLDEHGKAEYQEIWPPALVLRDMLVGSGQLPKFEDDAFKTDSEQEHFLIPTSEVALVNLHREEIIDPGVLPIRYAAYTPCFRAEAGSYGKDTRGLIRQHQFDKVELVHFAEPATSFDELEKLVAAAEGILQKLNLHYRVMNLAVGDLGFTSRKTYDLEVWLPGQNAYREISSCSNCGDFQARRAKIRYRPEKGAKPKFVHTLNGSGLAIGRTVVAILEQNQQKDGSVLIPEVLQPYVGAKKIEARSS